MRIELFASLIADDSGQDLVEYMLLIVLIALVLIAGLELFASFITDSSQSIGSEMQTVGGS